MAQALSLIENDRSAAIEQLHAATAIYTVEDVVRGLFEQIAWPRAGATLIDPSCGDGAFLAIALELLLDAEGVLPVEELLRRVTGWEIHPGACADARRRIAEVLARYGYGFDVATRLIVNTDFLTTTLTDRRYDVVVGNPPYLRFCNVPGILRAEYEAVLPDWARKDMLHSFLDRCAAILSQNGQLAAVTADRWLFAQGTARLREVLGERLVIAHVRRLDRESSFYRPKVRRRGSPPRIHPVQVVLAPSGGDPLTVEPIYPDGVPDIPGVPLAQLAEVRVAPWLGPEGVFVLRDAAAKALEGAELIPAIDTDDLMPDGTVASASRFAVRTSPDCTPCASIMAHLQRTAHRLPARARQRRIAWLPPERVDSFDLSEPVLVIPRIALRLRAYIVPAGVLPINHNLTVVGRGRHSLEALRDAIVSEPSQAWLRSVGHRLENGYFSITTTLLRQLPIDLA